MLDSPHPRRPARDPLGDLLADAAHHPRDPFEPPPELRGADPARREAAAVDVAVPPADDDRTAPIDLDAIFAEPQRPRLRITAGAAVIVALVVAAVVVLAVALQPRPAGGVPALAAPTATSLDAVPVDAAPAPVETPAATALVHVLGQVPSPGVYEIGPGGRVVDAIAAAGGLTDEADTAAVNLARPVVDGEQIYVPAIGETPPVPPGGGDAEGAADGTGSAGGLVNLNTATAAQLETLPRIGPAMAQRIIDHREANGPFAAVDDLIDVAGIGEATLEGLRPLVTV